MATDLKKIKSRFNKKSNIKNKQLYLNSFSSIIKLFPCIWIKTLMFSTLLKQYKRTLYNSLDFYNFVKTCGRVSVSLRKDLIANKTKQG